MIPSRLTPARTPTSLRGRALWHAPSTRALPASAAAWVAWYQARGWTVNDALHHACEARHHEVEVGANGRSRRGLLDVTPGVFPDAHHRAAGRPSTWGGNGEPGPIDWDLVNACWATNLLCWDATPDPRTLGPSHEVGKGEWQAFMKHYRLAGVRYPAYMDPRALYDRLLQLFERSLNAWGLPASALGLNGRLTLVIGGCTFPDRDNTSGTYGPMTPHAGELHLSMDQPWSAFAHEWFHALDHWLGQTPSLTGGRGAFNLDASDRGEAFGQRVTDPAWGPMLTAWHAANRTRAHWDTAGQAQAYWDDARRTFPQRLAQSGLQATSTRRAHERVAVYEAGCRERWERGLQNGDWSWMEEARFLSALVNKHRPGERSFDPRTDLDDWDALFEGVVLLQQRQDRSRFGSMTLRHATVQLYQQALTRDLIDPAIDPYYYGYSSELNAWSFEAACDPATQPMGRAFDHPWSIVRAVFPYAWGAQAERERHAWKAWLATLRPVLPGWSDGPG